MLSFGLSGCRSCQCTPAAMRSEPPSAQRWNQI
ncbi:hypothetical protein P9A48_gp83 [Xanthomonas phage Mallos]|uniref:Uncharacterized protein n=1 Tax=Xanthomonas phage Mallos TaxID=2939131 RepID=A0A9E7E1I9_9CAUD|nr:hypothetical protein P9A48_gp83 [Xanthomonas phage Mallos]URA07191.1 hypothetical protein Mallos_BL60083 [Xanthomonas phage Mallos]